MSHPPAFTAVFVQVLQEGAEDSAALESLVWHARRAVRGAEDDFRVLAIEVVEYLLAGELMVAGEVRDGDFEAWATSPAEALRQVRKACMVAGWNVQDSPIHFEITDAGERRLEQIEEED